MTDSEWMTLKALLIRIDHSIAKSLIEITELFAACLNKAVVKLRKGWLEGRISNPNWQKSRELLQQSSWLASTDAEEGRSAIWRSRSHPFQSGE
jgi:hypothetical protein